MSKLLEKWRSMPIMVKSSTAFFFSSLMLKCIAFFTTPIFTRILNQEQYGIIALYNSWLIILEVFALLGLTSAGSFNVGLNDNKEESYKYMSTCLGLCNVVTLVFFLIILMIKNTVENEFILPNKLLILMLVHFLFYPAQIFWLFYQRFEYKYKLSTLIVTISTIVGQAFSIYGVLNCNAEDGAFVKLLYAEIINILISLPIYFYILIKGKKFIDLKKWKTTLVFVVPLVPHYLAQHVMSGADKIMISNIIGNIEAGIYSIAMNMAMVLDVCWNAINASLVPYTFKNLDEKKYEGIGKIANTLVFAFAIMCIISMLVSPEIIKILAPEEYYIGIYLVPLLIVASFTKALYNLFANVEFYYKKSKKILKATVVATIVNLILNMIFIPKFGFMAAAYTTLFSYIVLIIMHYLGYKACNIDYKIYDIKLLFKMILVLILISILCCILYINIYLRYIALILLVVFCIIKRNNIFEKIRDLKK